MSKKPKLVYTNDYDFIDSLLEVVLYGVIIPLSQLGIALGKLLLYLLERLLRIDPNIRKEENNGNHNF